jgi:hypothetical protein
MLHRLSSYGLVLGVGTVALAVLLFAGRSGTYADPKTAPGLRPPSYVVLGAQATPNTGLTTISENPSAICPNAEFVAQAGAPNSAATPTEPTANAPLRRLATPCVHAVAWVGSPVP